MRERSGQLPNVGRGKHQILGVLLVSVFSVTIVSQTGLCYFGVDDATPSSCDCLKLRYLNSLKICCSRNYKSLMTSTFIVSILT